MLGPAGQVIPNARIDASTREPPLSNGVNSYSIGGKPIARLSVGVSASSGHNASGGALNRLATLESL